MGKKGKPTKPTDITFASFGNDFLSTPQLSGDFSFVSPDKTTKKPNGPTIGHDMLSTPIQTIATPKKKGRPRKVIGMQPTSKSKSSPKPGTPSNKLIQESLPVETFAKPLSRSLRNVVPR